MVLALDPRVANAVWQAIEGHLPPRPPDTHPLGCHRRRIADRDCFDGILIRLVTGCSWDVAARLCKASETTLRDRRTEWLTAGVFDSLVEEAVAACYRIIGLDLSEIAVDGSLHKAPCGGEGTGPNPTDRAKCGWKWSLATDRWGSRLAGSSTARTATTASCSNRPCKPSRAEDYCSTSRPCTWTAARTATSPCSAAPTSI
ncbi:MAG: hypothetical protein NVS3B26_27550 [Mycobacteriales bacterium]